jgi:hypothetical protein
LLCKHHSWMSECPCRSSSLLASFRVLYPLWHCLLQHLSVFGLDSNSEQVEFIMSVSGVIGV